MLYRSYESLDDNSEYREDKWIGVKHYILGINILFIRILYIYFTLVGHALKWVLESIGINI